MALRRFSGEFCSTGGPDTTLSPALLVLNELVDEAVVAMV